MRDEDRASKQEKKKPGCARCHRSPPPSPPPPAPPASSPLVQVAIPWYATTAARAFGLAGMLKVFLFTFPHSPFPALMLSTGYGVAVGAWQSAVAVMGGAALVAVAGRLDGTDALLRARRGVPVLVAACIAVAALVARVTPFDGELAAELVGRRPRPPVAAQTARAVAAPPTVSGVAPPARRTVADSDAEYAREFGEGAVEAGLASDMDNLEDQSI